MNEIISYSMIY